MKMRWECTWQGCFNIKRRPKIEVFDDCFAGKNELGDVDGIIERNRRFCLLEWKGSGGELTGGQRIMYERLTKHPEFTVVVVYGDAETMDVESYAVFKHGQKSRMTKASLDDVRMFFREWEKSVTADPSLLK